MLDKYYYFNEIYGNNYDDEIEDEEDEDEDNEDSDNDVYNMIFK